MKPCTEIIADAQTDQGVRRTNNEDAWWIGSIGGDARFMEPGPNTLTLSPAQTLAGMVVCDGVGGHNAGEVASQLGIQTLAALLTQRAAALRNPNTQHTCLTGIIEEVNRTIFEKAQSPGLESMGATLSFVLFSEEDRYHWAQAGDSRIYHFHAGKLRQVSQDHSPVGRLRQSGKLTEAEARTHPMRNQIDQSLGDPACDFAPDFGTEKFIKGDLILVCSDGLPDGLWDREIEEQLATVKGPEDVRPVVRALVQKSKEASGRDNITATLAYISQGPEEETPKPSWRKWLGL